MNKRFSKLELWLQGNSLVCSTDLTFFLVMNMENQPLVTNVTVEYDKFEVQGLRKIIDQWMSLLNMPQINEEKLKDHNMQPVGLGNTRILTDYSQKSPWTLFFSSGDLGTFLDQCPRRFLGIVDQNPSVSKSNQLHVVIF